MTQFTVEIDFDPSALRDIAAVRQSVTVVRRIGTTFVHSVDVLAEDVPAPDFPIAWLAVSPMQKNRLVLQKNRLVWDDVVAFYATTSLPPVGAVIELNAGPCDVRPGQLATLQGGFFTASDTSVGSVYRASNLEPDLMYLGLTAAASWNGNTRPTAPINIQPVLTHQSIELTLDPGAVTIFLSTIRADGSLLPADGSSGLNLTLDPNETVTVTFDRATSAFHRKP